MGELVRSISEALARYGDQQLMVIGGADIYEQFMVYADRMLLTEVGQSFEGDAYFPSFDEKDWSLLSRTEGRMDEKNKIPFTFCVYERAVSI